MDAVAAEGADLKAVGRQTLHGAWWGMECELWRCVQLLGGGDFENVRSGRVKVGSGTRRELAWQFFGIVVPVDVLTMERAMEELENAREVLQGVAKAHTEAAERLNLGL